MDNEMSVAREGSVNGERSTAIASCGTIGLVPDPFVNSSDAPVSG
jgi:hypothetical protein